jgi:type II secretory pathway pseudopilin PulG
MKYIFSHQEVAGFSRKTTSRANSSPSTIYHLPSTQNGFTAVELLITLLLTATVITVVMRSYATISRLADRTTDLLAANSLAYQKLESYENSDFGDIPTADASTPVEDFGNSLPASLAPPRQGKVYIVSQSATMKYLFVRITYRATTGDQIVEYGTLVQKSGVGR